MSDQRHSEAAFVNTGVPVARCAELALQLSETIAILRRHAFTVPEAGRLAYAHRLLERVCMNGTYPSSARARHEVQFAVRDAAEWNAISMVVREGLPTEFRHDVQAYRDAVSAQLGDVETQVGGWIGVQTR